MYKVRTTTDSGSNFIIAFYVSAAQNDTEVEENEGDMKALHASDQVDYYDASTVLDEDSGMEYQLPPHQRCAYHLLSLVATTNAA